MNSKEKFENLLTKLKSSIQADTTDLELVESGKCFRTNIKGETEEIQAPLTLIEIEKLAYLLSSSKNYIISNKYPVLNTDYENLRVNINLSPAKKEPTLTIRVHHLSFFSFEDLQNQGMFSYETSKILLDYLKKRANILISGETGSGKTTLLSALVNKIDEEQKLIIIENTPEIACNHSYITTMKIKEEDDNSQEGINGVEAVREALRQNPDRIIYGEVRDKTALSLIKAWNTGHSGGLATIHSNSTKMVKDRLISLCLEDTNNNSYEFTKSLIDNVLDLAIQIEIVNKKRQITEIYDFKKNTRIL